MNILLTIQDPLNPDSGAAGSTLRLGQCYQKLGHQVNYYSLDNLPKWLSDKQKRVLFPEFVAAHLIKLLHTSKIDVVDGSSGDLWLWALIVQRFSQLRPLVVTRVHNLEHTYQASQLAAAQRGEIKIGWKYWLYRGSIRLWEVATSLQAADLVFQLNRSDLEYTVQHLSVRRETSYIFPNGMPDEFRNLPLERTPTEENAIIRIAQIGTYIERKGIKYSSPALNRILKKYSNVELTLLGTQCLECADSNRIYADFDPAIHDRIRIIDKYIHSDLPQLLQGHHIKIFASTYEAFGKALVEAMACGLAPVTTSAEGPMEIVKEGHDALVVPLRDEQAIFEALDKLITDRNLLDRLRCNAYQTAQAYDWLEIAKKRLYTYQERLDRIACTITLPLNN
ncbi:MAG: glycosyltransferase family 4 protein [Elainella sp. Prado103]|nr:glycosyltransferase family 4 protein [Elainella sp. Prado103]